MIQTSVTVTVNGRRYARSVDPRCLLADFLREDLGLTGTHVGCEHGICGACTVFLNGESVRSCLTFAVQADGAEILTVEGLAGAGGRLSVLQETFWEQHGLQCGFCTPGMLITAAELLRENADPTETQVRERMAGVLCRCTGYHHIIQSVLTAARRLQAQRAVPASTSD